jgi:hypothetical protein
MTTFVAPPVQHFRCFLIVRPSTACCRGNRPTSVPANPAHAFRSPPLRALRPPILAADSAPHGHLLHQISRMVVRPLFARARVVYRADGTRRASPAPAAAAPARARARRARVWCVSDLPRPVEEPDCAAEWVRVLLSVRARRRRARWPLPRHAAAGALMAAAQGARLRVPSLPCLIILSPFLSHSGRALLQ